MLSQKIREWSLSLTITVVAILITLGLLKKFAPEILKSRTDLQLVQIDKKVPPFFEGALRTEDWKDPSFLLQDPLTKIRAKPFLPNQGGNGPHDLLGFRNRAIPNQADVVVIGDSQTYGNNASIDMTWPGQLTQITNNYNAKIYSMATGGWGPVQYYYAFQKAMFFRPRVIIIAFYTGNDAFDAFQLAYGNPEWSYLKPTNKLTAKDTPTIEFPPPQPDRISTKLENGMTTVLTPNYRLQSNENTPAINAGYQIMANVTKELGEIGKSENISVLVTMIPTKEFVYRNIVDAHMKQNEKYRQLIAIENIRLQTFANTVSELPGITYVPVVDALTAAATNPKLQLYTTDADGHPLRNGYAVIAAALSAQLQSALTSTFSGIVAIEEANKAPSVLLVHQKKYLRVPDRTLLNKAGWHYWEIPVWTKLPADFQFVGSAPEVSLSDIAPEQYQKYISDLSPQEFR